MAGVVYPVGYKSIVEQVMDRDFRKKIIHQVEQYEGYGVEVHGWRMFCDGKSSSFKGKISDGNLYDVENGLGYIGYLSVVNGKPYPVIDYWAMRTRIDYPPLARFKIDKTDAIYRYESKDFN